MPSRDPGCRLFRSRASGGCSPRGRNGSSTLSFFQQCRLWFSVPPPRAPREDCVQSAKSWAVGPESLLGCLQFTPSGVRLAGNTSGIPAKIREAFLGTEHVKPSSKDSPCLRIGLDLFPAGEAPRTEPSELWRIALRIGRENHAILIGCEVVARLLETQQQFVR